MENMENVYKAEATALRKNRRDIQDCMFLLQDFFNEFKDSLELAPYETQAIKDLMRLTND